MVAKRIAKKVDTAIIRRLISSGKVAGPAGAPGRWVGRHLGLRLAQGARIIIDDPREYIQEALIQSTIYEPGVMRVLSALLQPGDLFLDVGANIGYHSIVQGHRGVRVHSFEPLPRLAARLRDSIRLNRLTDTIAVNQIALSDSDGEASLYEAKREDDGSHSLVAGITADDVNAVTVKTVKMDSFLRDSQIGTPALIKIDVEGAEAKVLDGGKETLGQPNSPAVVIETSDDIAKLLGETAAGVLERLSSRGYLLYRIHDAAPWVRPIDLQKLSFLVANYLAVRPEDAVHSRAVESLL